MQVVLADGSLVVANDDENGELFWAVRGAGANFGIAVAFDFVAEEIDEVGLALVTHLVEDPARFLLAFGDVASSAPRDTTAELLVGPGNAMTTAVVVDSADREKINARITPFLELARLVQHYVVLTPYAGVMNLHAAEEQHGVGEPVGRSGLLNTIVPAFAAEIAALLRSGSVQLFQVRSLGGAIADVPQEATAFAHRDAQFQVNALGVVADELDKHWARIRPHLDGIYPPFETDGDVARLSDAFPPATLERLRVLKRELDPRNLFRDNFNVDPDAVTTDVAA